MTYLFAASLGFVVGTVAAFVFVAVISNLKAAALLDQFKDTRSGE